VRDSKKLSEKRREEVFLELTEREDVVYRLVTATRQRIDRDNVLRANHWAMRQAVTRLGVEVDFALIDGLPVDPFPVASRGLVKGDAKSLSIAAASILAKVTRDRMMKRYAKQYPQYGFERHKGYGTPEHLEALRIHGPCPIHRLSFAPVAEAARAH
jgi:ribonuclease HII